MPDDAGNTKDGALSTVIRNTTHIALSLKENPMTRKSFTVRTNTTNHGGFQLPYTVNRWLILFEDEGDVEFICVSIPSTSCPNEWLKQQGYTLEVDALAQMLR